MPDPRLTPEPNGGRHGRSRRCGATTRAGRPCDRPPLTGGRYCVGHDPDRKAVRKPRQRTGSEALMSVAELSDLTGLSTPVIYDGVRLGRIPHLRIGRAVWFSRAAIHRWLDAAQAQGEPASAGASR